jgi:hypothetical protein
MRKVEKEVHHQHTQISLLDKLFTDLLPDYEIKNPYKEYLENHLTSDQKTYLPLVQRLIKHLTLLYRSHRLEPRKNYYEATKEDVLAALKLLQGHLSPLSVLRPGTLYSYQELQKLKHPINRREATAQTGYKKTHMQRILNELYRRDLVRRTGNKNRGWYYQVK